MSAAAMPLIGAGVSAGGGVIASGMTNQSNQKIAQMNNEFNERMLQKQMDYNTQMYEKQLGDQWKFYNDSKEYNSATSQAQRLKAAGINPSIAMSGSNAGTVSNQQAPSQMPINPPSATPYSADYSAMAQGIGGAVDALLRAPDNSVKSAQAENLRIEGQYIASKAMADLYQKLSSARNDTERVGIQKLVAGFQKRLADSQVNVNNAKLNEIASTVQLKTAQRLAINEQLKWMPKQVQAELALKASEVARNYASKNLTDKQAAHEIEKLAETVVRANGQALQNEFDSETYDDRVKQIKEVLWNTMHEAVHLTGLTSIIGRTIRPLYD